MMSKGKGYPENVKDTYANDITGGRNIRSALNEWDDYSWKADEKGEKK
mgnify:CR=1 FL=1